MSTLSLEFVQSEKHYQVQEQVTAGISKMCDLNLADYFDGAVETISRCHFQVANTSEGFFIVDLRSTNGTAVNDDLLFPRTPQFLRHGDLIKLAQNESFLIRVMLERNTSGEGQRSDTRILNRLLGNTRGPRVQKSGIYFDERTERFFVDGKPIPHNYFTDSEHRLLRYLYQNAERVCSYHNLAQHVWGGWAHDNTITQRISQLRKKLSRISAGSRESYIQTGRGYVRGYMLKREA